MSQNTIYRLSYTLSEVHTSFQLWNFGAGTIVAWSHLPIKTFNNTEELIAQSWLADQRKQHVREKLRSSWSLIFSGFVYKIKWATRHPCVFIYLSNSPKRRPYIAIHSLAHKKSCFINLLHSLVTKLLHLSKLIYKIPWSRRNLHHKFPW